MYNHPKRLTQKAIATASLELSTFAAEAQRLGDFPVDDFKVRVSKGGGFVTFTNALGTIAQHKVAHRYLRSMGVWVSFAYSKPNDPFTTIVVGYPATTPDNEADREYHLVTELLAARGEFWTNVRAAELK
jgi:hypothetical protein